MKKIAKFHNVSYGEFEKAWKGEFPEAKEDEIKAVYEELKLPRRATRALQDMISIRPLNIILETGRNGEGFQPVSVWRWKRAVVLKLYPEADLDFKFRCS